jgi:hypothetical protein
VFGGIAGESAAAYISGESLAEIPEAELLSQLYDRLGNPSGGMADIPSAMRAVREIMWLDGAIARSGERCREGLGKLEELEASFNPAEHFEKGSIYAAPPACTAPSGSRGCCCSRWISAGRAEGRITGSTTRRRTRTGAGTSR